VKESYEIQVNLYYSYTLTDLKRLIMDLRTTYFGNPDAFYENPKSVIVLDPCEDLTEHLNHMLLSVFDLNEDDTNQTRMIPEGIQPWKNPPQYFLIPVLEVDGMQWRLLRLHLDYMKREIRVLIHDPLGKHDWPGIEDAITNSFGRLFETGGFFLTVDTFEQLQHQRRYETGPLIINNIKCHLACLTSNEIDLKNKFDAFFPPVDKPGLENLRQRQFQFTEMAQAKGNWMSAVNFRPTPLEEIDPGQVKTKFKCLIGLLIQNYDSQNKTIHFTTACVLLAKWLGCEPDELVFEDEKNSDRAPFALQTLSKHLNKTAESEWKPLNAFRTMTLLYIIALVDTIKMPTQGLSQCKEKKQKINLLLNECYVSLELLRIRTARLHLQIDDVYKQVRNILIALEDGESYLLHTGPAEHAAYAVITNDDGEFKISYIDIVEGKEYRSTKGDIADLSRLLKYLLKAKQDEEDALSLEDSFTSFLSNSTSSSQQRKRSIATAQNGKPTCICNNYMESLSVRYPEAEARQLLTYLKGMAVECETDYREEWLGIGLNFNGADSILDQHLTALSIHSYNAVDAADRHQLIGRQTLMQQLSNSLLKGTLSPLPLRLLIHGLPGMGKTVCAEHLIAKYADKFPFIIKCRGDSKASFEQDLCQALRDLPGCPRQIHSRLIWIKQWLIDNPIWLIFVDDLIDPQWIDTYLPSQAGVVFATSFQQLNGFQNVTIEKMSVEEASQFFSDQSFENQQTIKDLIQMLGGLPLALRLATLYMQEEMITIIKYYNLLQDQKSRSDYIEFNHFDESHAALLPTISLLCERIKTRNPQAFHRLLQIAMCGSNQIPCDYLTCFSSDSDINLLSSFELIHRQSSIMTMHQLIHTALRDGLIKGCLGSIDLSIDRKPLAMELCSILLKSFRYYGIRTNEERLQKCLILENHVRQFIMVAEQWLENEPEFMQLKLSYAYYIYHRHYQTADLSILITIIPGKLESFDQLILGRLLYKYALSVNNPELLKTLSIKSADMLINEQVPSMVGSKKNQEGVNYFKSLIERCEVAAISETIQTQRRLYQKAGQAYESLYRLRPNVAKYLVMAMTFYKQALKLAGHGDDHYYISLAIAKVYLKQKQYKLALQHSDSCFQFFKRNDFFQAAYFNQALELQFECLYNLKRNDPMQKLVEACNKNDKLPKTSKLIVTTYQDKLNTTLNRVNSGCWANFYAAKPQGLLSEQGAVDNFLPDNSRNNL
jgi:hypothetical protein